MSEVHMKDVMQVRQIQLAAIRTVGFRGEGIQDERELFRQLKSRKNEIEHRIDEHEYLVISPDGLYVAAATDRFGAIPEGMESMMIPADTYQVFRLEEKYIGDFWNYFCNPAAQAEYNLNVDKIRFEIFKEELQPTGVTEIYFPVND